MKNVKTRKQIRLKRTKIKKKIQKQINDYFERKYRSIKNYENERRSHENGQLKPGYNLQIATNSQFVLSYNVSKSNGY